MKKLAFIFLTASCFYSHAQLITIKDQSQLSLKQLKDFVKQNSIYTIDQLVSSLPEQMLKNSLLVYNSHALNQQLVRPDTPRIVLFNKDASLILAMTQNPGSQMVSSSLDKLEIISFNKNAGLFEMYDVAFDGKANPFERAAQVNPKLCLSCHGANPRPLFQDYNTWPGFYGSFSQEGVAVKGTPEYDSLKNFLSGRTNLVRYQDLDLNQLTEGQSGFMSQASGFGAFYDEKHFSPLLMFGAMLEYKMYDRLAKKIEAIPEAQNLKYLLAHLGRADECRGSKQGHRSEIKDTYSEWLKLLTTADLEKSNKIGLLYEEQVRKDHLEKEKQFTPFNAADKKLDPRGMMNLPYETMVIGSPPWVKVDKVAFTNQIVFMESIGRFLKLNTEDFSTALRAPSQGVFHIRSGKGLFEDEQMFKGLYEAFVKANSIFISESENMNCSDLKTKALAELAKIPMAEPATNGLFYR